MQAKSLIAAAAVALAAHAGLANAAEPAAQPGIFPYAQPVGTSTLTRAQVRDDVVAAQRAGQIPAALELADAYAHDASATRSRDEVRAEGRIVARRALPLDSVYAGS